MDQTLSLAQQSSTSPSRSAQACDSITPPGSTTTEEEPESPGRSPQPVGMGSAAADPLAEVVSLMAGVLLALLAVLVPIAAVVGDSDRPSPGVTVRTGW